jgi:hypothetical protein
MRKSAFSKTIVNSEGLFAPAQHVISDCLLVVVGDGQPV